MKNLVLQQHSHPGTEMCVFSHFPLNSTNLRHFRSFHQKVRFGREWEDFLPFGAQGWNRDLVTGDSEVKWATFLASDPKSENMINFMKFAF